ATRLANAVRFAPATRSSDGRQTGSLMPVSSPISAPASAFLLGQQRAKPLRQRRRLRAREVDPDELCRAVGVFALVHPDFVVALDAALARRADEHLHFDLARIRERGMEDTARVDDDRPFPLVCRQAEALRARVQPLD